MGGQGALERLPARWRTDRLLLGDRSRWRVVDVRGDDKSVVVAVEREGRATLLGRGDAGGVARLVDALAADPGAADLVGAVTWLSHPRGAQPSAAALTALALEPVSAWDWMVTGWAPGVLDGEADVVRLDPDADAEAIRACLAQANPGTSADPSHRGEAGWWGVGTSAELVGVVGAAVRAGDPGGRDTSWHLHGLGVLPRARGAGLGAALTAAATRAGLRDGAEWVSLGLYASNGVARRVYERLGFATEACMASYGPAVTTGSEAGPHH
ncbi:MAG: GNAT family N-acetyltransferase [Cellulomonadaceae bacterium]|nr:GNAT family N-acetyltransferase [Cellulomonadaceae bacterium]